MAKKADNGGSDGSGKDAPQRGPAPRPALRKSIDASVHPALAGKSAGIGLRPSGSRPAEGPASQKETAKPGKNAARSADTDTAAPPAWTLRTGTAADAVRPTKKDPAVTIKVTIPKSMRKSLRQAAKQRGMEPEALAAEFLAERLQHHV